MGTRSDSSGNRNLPKKPKIQRRNDLLTEINPEAIVVEDEFTVSIKDLYPKARFHYLVCPKEDVAALKDVKLEHLDLLKHMHKVGESLLSKHEGSNFLLGYHCVPSKIRLHLHVISDDFDSPCLKTKKHWNSFTTDFFAQSKSVISELETKGKINLKTVDEYAALLKKPLKCHKCSYKPKHMPDLKHHIKIHIK